MNALLRNTLLRVQTQLAAVRQTREELRGISTIPEVDDLEPEDKLKLLERLDRKIALLDQSDARLRVMLDALLDRAGENA